MNCKHLVLALSTMALMSQPALAEDTPVGTTTISISPVHLAIGIFEAAAEFRFNEAVSLTLIGGAGSVEMVTGEKVFVYEAGLQARYYADDFEGPHAGFEAVMLRASLEDGESLSSTADGIAMGPLLGWKFVLDSGLTFDLQGGYQFLVGTAEAEDSESGETATDANSTTVVLVNINVGWTF